MKLPNPLQMSIKAAEGKKYQCIGSEEARHVCRVLHLYPPVGSQM